MRSDRRFETGECGRRAPAGRVGGADLPRFMETRPIDSAARMAVSRRNVAYVAGTKAGGEGERNRETVEREERGEHGNGQGKTERATRNEREKETGMPEERNRKTESTRNRNGAKGINKHGKHNGERNQEQKQKNGEEQRNTKGARDEGT